MLRRWILLTCLAACGNGVPSDVTGPFTGTPRRYVVDSFTLPATTAEARAIGGDLDGDDHPDNQLGATLATLANAGNLTTHASDMIASGAIASSVIIRADAVVGDSTVSVSYDGSDGAPATRVGGTFDADGVFLSNRAATTRVPGDAVARLPIFVDSAPSDVPLGDLQIELTPDGVGGYDARISAGVVADEAKDRLYAGIAQMVATEPRDHRLMLMLFDMAPKDWTISREEVASNSVIESLLSPDVTIQGRERVSIGFGMHLKPCDAGTCVNGPAVDACHDRVKNGDESDVDCGGSCRSCKASEACGDAGDCDSNACDAGQCRAPTCSDGVLDGFETDIDCGGPCGTCELGEQCWSAGDCASQQCGEPCVDPDPLACIDLGGYDTCQPPPPPP